MPGQYQVAVEAEGYEIAIKAVNVSRASVLERRSNLVNFALRPALGEVGQEVEEMGPVQDYAYGAEGEPTEGGWGTLSPDQVGGQ